VVRSFKAFSSRRINQSRKLPGAEVWQRGYYEHVIRNETDLNEIREYIIFNPQKWDLDHENPDYLFKKNAKP
jgi:putative transposase